MWGVFLNESDGYTYSASTLVGLYSSKDIAETALLEHIELASKHEAERTALSEERKKVVQTYLDQQTSSNKRNKQALEKSLIDYQTTLLEIHKREEALPSSLFNIVDNNIDHYEIKEITVDQPICYL